MAVELNLKAVPHIIPGYTGHCPQYKYHKYVPYGAQNHRLKYNPLCEEARKEDVQMEKTIVSEQPHRFELDPPEMRAEEWKRKYARISPKPFKYPSSPYDPYDVTSAPNTIYKKESMLASYTGHIPGRQYIIGKTFAYMSYDAKKWLRWSVNGIGWQVEGNDINLFQM